MSIVIGGVTFAADPEVVSLVDECSKRIATLEREAKDVWGNGAKCPACGFRYWEHRGSVPPCPVCALAASRAEVTRLLEEVQYVLADLVGWRSERPIRGAAGACGSC